MKTIYHLSIHAWKGERQRWLDVYYTHKEKAIAELKRWTDQFRKEWQIPEKSDDEWDLNEKFNDEMTINIQNIGKNRTRENRCLLSGHVFESFLIEEGEEVIGMCGDVFAAGDNPDILFTNKSPLMNNNTSFTASQPINMSKKERSDFAQATGGAVIQNEEKATEYYELRKEIINEETHRFLSK